jgi:hypothetical protein
VTARRFAIDFAHPADIEATRKTIVVALSDDECRYVRHYRGPAEQLDVETKAMALRHAYRTAPAGYMHDCDNIKQLREH